MSGEMVPDPRIRLSDAERERFAERLREAVGEGRLTLDEFEERLAKVLAAPTYEEVRPYLADLPAGSEARRGVTLRAKSSGMKRIGRWRVPRRLTVEAQSARIKLDFTRATLDGPLIDIDLDARSSSVVLVLPRGGSADTTNMDMISSSNRVRVGLEAGAAMHVRIRGQLKSSSLTVRYRRRLLGRRR